MTSNWFFSAFLVFLLSALFLWALGAAVFGGLHGISNLFRLPWLGYGVLLGSLQIAHLFFPIDHQFSIAFLMITAGSTTAVPVHKSCLALRNPTGSSERVVKAPAARSPCLLHFCSRFQRFYQASLSLRSRALLSPGDSLDRNVPDRPRRGQFDPQLRFQPKRLSGNFVPRRPAPGQDRSVVGRRVVALARADAVSLRSSQTDGGAQGPPLTAGDRIRRLTAGLDLHAAWKQHLEWFSRRHLFVFAHPSFPSVRGVRHDERQFGKSAMLRRFVDPQRHLRVP